MNFSDLVMGESYEFSPLASAIWPRQTNAVYLGAVAYDVAAAISPVGRQHAATLAYLPAGTSSNFSKLKYLLFKANDNTFAMAEDWINQGTLKRVSTGVVTVVLSQASLQDATRIRSALSAAGFQISSIT